MKNFLLCIILLVIVTDNSYSKYYEQLTVEEKQIFATIVNTTPNLTQENIRNFKEECAIMWHRKCALDVVGYNIYSSSIHVLSFMTIAFDLSINALMYISVDKDGIGFVEKIRCRYENNSYDDINIFDYCPLITFSYINASGEEGAICLMGDNFPYKYSHKIVESKSSNSYIFTFREVRHGGGEDVSKDFIVQCLCFTYSYFIKRDPDVRLYFCTFNNGSEGVNDGRPSIFLNELKEYITFKDWGK